MGETSKERVQEDKSRALAFIGGPRGLGRES